MSQGVWGLFALNPSSPQAHVLLTSYQSHRAIKLRLRLKTFLAAFLKINLRTGVANSQGLNLALPGTRVQAWATNFAT